MCIRDSDYISFHIDQVDRRIGGLRIQGSVKSLHADGPVGGPQARRPGAVLGSDGGVGGGDAVEQRGARNLDDKPGPLVIAPLGGPDGADRNGIGRVICFDQEPVGAFLGGAVLGAADVHRILVPPGNLDGAVKGFDRQPAIWLQREAVMEILAIPFVIEVEIVKVAAGEEEQSGGRRGNHKLLAHRCP